MIDERTRRPASAVLPHGTHVVRTRSGGRSVRVHRRIVIATVALVGVGVAAGALALTTGEYPISLGDVVGALLGDRDGLADSIVVNWRLPRVLATLVFGAALGASGALFQTLAANPLASPDVIGFDTGAATGALIAILVFSAGSGTIILASLAGGCATALVVYLLAFRGGLNGFRLIIVGIAVSAMLAGVNEYLWIKSDEYEMVRAQNWLIGSLNGITWSQMWWPMVALAVLLPAAAGLGRPLRWIEMGDDAAKALGVRLNPVRLGSVFVGVGLAATVTAVCGPIAFVALAAPQVAKRAARSPGISMAASMATGAALLAVSDVLALRLFAPTELPVGAVTVSVGGCYFVWLIWQERRRR